jgi:ubiquinone/menaquinone biosynthesis C-methylase UbiE
MESGKPNLFLRLRLAFMRVFFKLLYNQMAWSYDLVADIVSVGMWKDWVRAVIPYITGPRVLEIGHGPGHLQVALHRQSQSAAADLQIIGLDKSQSMGRIARRRLKQQGFQPLLVNSDAQKLPLPGRSIDQVVATFPSEYIASQHTIAEVQRVLKPGGQLVILALAWITGDRTHHRLAARLFDITGQAPPWDDRYLEPARAHGFESQVERVSLPNSQVLIITITIPPSVK